MSILSGNAGHSPIARLLDQFRGDRRQSARTVAAMRLSPELLSDIGLSETGELLVVETIGPASRATAQDPPR